MRISEWQHKLSRFRELRSAERRLILRSAAYLCAARVRLLVLPFRQLAKRLSQPVTKTRQLVDRSFPGRLSRALAVASSHVPWRSDCFVQAIAARQLLQAEGFESTIHIGVERAGDATIAGHAWLSCGDAIVVGGEDLERYTEFLSLTA